MAYDRELADRMRLLIGPDPAVVEKRMFGGLAFLVNGHMAVAASGQGGLLVRIEPARTEQLVAEPHVRPMAMRGRALDGWLRVDAEAVDDDEPLRRWVDEGVGYARTLAPRPLSKR